MPAQGRRTDLTMQPHYHMVLGLYSWKAPTTMTKRLIASFFVFFIFCAVLAFIDFDWNAKTEQSAKESIRKQILYMNVAQMKTYFNDLEVIDSARLFGGARGRLIHGKEAHELHDLANQIRAKRGNAPVPFPSKSITESIILFFLVPFKLVFN